MQIHKQILNSVDDRYNSSNVKTPNPDLATVIPNIQKLAKAIAKRRADLTGSYQRSKLEQDQWNQFRLLENEVMELKNRIINQKVSVDKTFTIIGNDESEALQLLKEHQRLEDAVEQTKVNYTHLLEHGSILTSNFPAKKSEIDAILKDLENSWNYLTALIVQRSNLLDIVISFRQETEVYFSKLPEWMNFIKNQPENLNKPLTELEEISKQQEEVENDIELSYSRSYDESMQLSQRLVINWIDAHGLPHMRKKTTIGTSSPEVKKLHHHHQSFKSVAENTRKNAFQLYQVAEKLSENANGDTEVVKDRLQQLSNVVHNFFNLMEHRELLLTQSAMFHLHYTEITQWYEKIKDQSIIYETVPINPEDCENLQDKLIKESEATSQAYSTVIEESDKLIRMLKKQKELLDVDITKDEAHIEEMTNFIQTQHSKEIERWPYQRNCVQIGHISKNFINECTTICKQIIEWRKDLVPLQPPHRERAFYEYLKCTDENIKQIEDASKDFAQRYSEIIHMIETKQLNLIDVATEKPITELLTQKFQQLNHVVDETLKRANGLKQELSTNRDIRETFLRTDAVVNEMKKEIDKINQLMVRIPETKDEAKRLGIMFEEIKPKIQKIIPSFNNIRDIFNCLVMNTSDKQRRDIMMANNTLLRTWETCIAKMNDCQKFISQAIGFHNMNEGN
uniref:Muscle-specific protein 300 n=1 Tax=Panagrolaimus superbus TaxID=310955 RepID=A0A914ZBF2_9BILA